MDRWLLSVGVSTVAFMLGAFAVLPPPAAHAEAPCDGQSCSGRGSCLSEDDRAYCFCHEGYTAVGLSCVPVASPDADGTSDGGESESTSDTIIGIARGEVGRELEAVGRDRHGYPERLGHYVDEGALWCSDFVSWVYRAAGVPLTGGYEGGWLVTNNRAVRTWFERRRRWVPASSPRFQTFEPLPGDYVRIETPTWGHSALVERVEGDTLHIIEGNAEGRVRANRYRHFRRHPKVGGFGIMTRAAGRRIWRPLLPSFWMARLRSR